MDTLRAWIITLVTITVLCSIIEKFAPEGNLNKYVRLICGLSMTAAMAMPVLNMARNGLEFDSMVWKDYMKLSERELRRRIDRLMEEDSKQMLEVYRQSLLNDIRGRFRGNPEFSVVAADAVLYEDPDDERFCMIRTLYLKLEPSSQNSNRTIGQSTVEYVKNQLTEVFAIDGNQIIIELSGFSGGG